MDLNLDIRTKGRASSPLAWRIERPVEAADLAFLDQPRPRDPLMPLAKIRERHHSAARALAQGLTTIEVCAVTGYTPTRIGHLQQDPAFQNLVAMYRERQTEIWSEAQDRAKAAVMLGLEVMTDRLEAADEKDDEEAFELAERLVKAATPVSGLVSRPTAAVQVNVNLSGRLEAARRRAGLIEGQALPPALGEEPGA